MSYGSRTKDIKYLEKKNNLNIHCWGKGWPNGRINKIKCMKFFKIH